MEVPFASRPIYTNRRCLLCKKRHRILTLTKESNKCLMGNFCTFHIHIFFVVVGEESSAILSSFLLPSSV